MILMIHLVLKTPFNAILRTTAFCARGIDLGAREWLPAVSEFVTRRVQFKLHWNQVPLKESISNGPSNGSIPGSSTEEAQSTAPSPTFPGTVTAAPAAAPAASVP